MHFRDAALVRIASDALLRVSELVALQVDDISTEDDGSGRVEIRRSKTDQESKGVTLYLGEPTMRALRDWLGSVAGGGIRAAVPARATGRGRTQAEAISRTSAREIIAGSRCAMLVLRGSVSRTLAESGRGLQSLAARWRRSGRASNGGQMDFKPKQCPRLYARAQYAGIARRRRSSCGTAAK